MHWLYLAMSSVLVLPVLRAESNLDTSQENEEANLNETVDETEIAAESKLQHPLSADAWRTRDAVLASGFSDGSALQSCQDEVAMLAEKSLNEEALLSSRSFIMQSIEKNTAAFHWCFYVNQMRLDERLLNPTISISQKYQDFIQTSKTQWILASALDAVQQSTIYMGYLRKRFQQTSQQQFGRDLVVITPPLGDQDRRSLVPTLDKAAGQK